jgi:hypothetical protein
MRKIEFWKKASNYSIAVCGIVLIAKMFFIKYLEKSNVPIFFIAGVALFVFIFSELMKFILKRKS